MLSGSVGCLRGDALIETASGRVPISDIKKSHYLLSFDHLNNRFCFRQGSDAFLKGRDYLYRVVTKHGEFVASGNHQIATSDGAYLPVSYLFDNLSSLPSKPSFLQTKYPSYDQKSSLSDVLHYWKTIASFLYHCEERIRQYDPRLLSELDIVRDAFPLQDDALIYSQFSYKNKFEHMDGLAELESRHARIFAECDHAYMRDFAALLENRTEAEAGAYTEAYSKPLSRMFEDIPLFQQSQMNSVHPRALLFLFAKLCRFLILSLSSYEEEPSTDGAIESIEKLDKKEWYWDIQVPNTNNYVCNNMIHHNSSKSLTAAHIAVTHCLMFENSNVLIGRRALPQLKATLCNKIREHLANINNLNFRYNETTGSFRFPNGSKITAISWADGLYEKLGSYEASCAIIEELAENTDKAFYDKILQRVGRLPHVRENFVLSCTNPSSPSSVWYKHLIQSKSEKVRVFYSNTFDNPYLPASYIEGLKERLDAKQARRMIYGEWVEINQEVIYYEYDSSHNFINANYDIDSRYPIRLMYDFNIAVGKPLSLVLGQYKKDDDTWHIFDEIIIEGQRTADSLEEMESRGYFKNYRNHKFIIHGDAAGRAKDTRSNRSDYDIIDKFLANMETKVNYEVQVPKRNPSIRDRHNCVNGYLCNANKKRKLFVYKGCDIVDEGFRLTCLKDKGQYIEDDSKHYQHCTTAIGYGLKYVEDVVTRQSEGFGKVL